MPWTWEQHKLAEFVKHNPEKAKAEGISMTKAAATKMASEGIKDGSKSTKSRQRS